MKTAFATSISGEAFIELFKVFLFSLKKNNPSISFPYFVFYDTIPEKDKEEMLQIYPNICFQKVNKALYINKNKNSSKWWIFEAYNIKGFDKVITFDADILCVKHIDEFLEIECKIGMHREIYRKTSFNSGVVIIGKELLNTKTYVKLLNSEKEEGRYGNDQNILNWRFKEIITEISMNFNVLVNEWKCVNEWEVVFIHYIHKPNHDLFKKRLPEELLKRWEQYYKEMQSFLERRKQFIMKHTVNLQTVKTQVRPNFEYQLQYVKKFIYGQGIDMGCGNCPLIDDSCTMWVDEHPQPIALEQIDKNKFLIAPAQTLKVGNGTLDYVHSSHMVEDLGTREEMVECLNNWATFLKSGGHLVILIPDMENGRYPTVEDGGNPSHKINVGKKFFEELVKDLKGLKIIQIDTIPHDKSCSLDIVFEKE